MSNKIHNKKEIIYSIITVTFNCVLQIEKTIKSILEQNYNKYEIIIIDGDSSDGTIEILNKYKQFFNVFITEKDDGIYYAMNKGIKYANGDWLIFLNAGDIFYNKYTLLNVAGKLNSHFSMIAGHSIYVNLSKNIFTKAIKLKPGYMPAAHQSIFFCKKFLFNKNYNTFYKVAADYDLVCQLSKDKIFYLDEIISYIDFYGYSNSNQYLFIMEYQLIIKHYFGKLIAFKWMLLTYPKFLLKLFINKFYKYDIGH